MRLTIGEREYHVGFTMYVNGGLADIYINNIWCRVLIDDDIIKFYKNTQSIMLELPLCDFLDCCVKNRVEFVIAQ